MRFTVDVFCKVIDNFGDAGVCLRLARTLVLQHDCAVRLFCDELALLERFEPAPPLYLSFHTWQHQDEATPPQGVVCGFGCDLNEMYLNCMMASAIQPAYLHLEYLSAEAWVESTHGVMSIHPRRLTRQRFCNPGFTAQTGGLLRSQAALKRPQAGATFQTLISNLGLDSELQSINAEPLDALRLFLFAYPTRSVDALIAASRRSARPMHWVLPRSEAGERVYTALSGQAGHTFTRLPWLTQLQFDTVLRCCDAAWVRGEDSAVTALFAGIPMLWQLYPQDDGAEQIKLQAYLDAVQRALPEADLNPWISAMKAANAIDSADDAAISDTNVSAMEAFLNSCQREPSSPNHHAQWANHCATQVPDLAVTVVNYLKHWRAS